jgi:hypothetical protein
MNKSHFTKTIICILLAVSLTACAPKVFYRPDATKEQASADKFACMMSANEVAPPVAGTGGYWTNGQSKAAWTNNGGGASSSGGMGFVGSHDINRNNRNEIIQACMESRGYVLTRDPPKP